jgi:hypothetical protein
MKFWDVLADELEQMSRRKLILCASLVAATVVAAKSMTAPADAGAAERRNDRQVITRVIGRDFQITVTSSPRGPLYSITDGSGQTIASHLTLDQLRAQHPQLHQRIDPALSNSTSAVPWAGVDTD